jgi:hypothetical protein
LLAAPALGKADRLRNAPFRRIPHLVFAGPTTLDGVARPLSGFAPRFQRPRATAGDLIRRAGPGLVVLLLPFPLPARSRIPPRSEADDHPTQPSSPHHEIVYSSPANPSHPLHPRPPEGCCRLRIARITGDGKRHRVGGARSRVTTCSSGGVDRLDLCRWPSLAIQAQTRQGLASVLFLTLFLTVICTAIYRRRLNYSSIGYSTALLHFSKVSVRSF